MEKEAVLTILGSNSAIPAYGRFPTCQHLSFLSENFLIDCGEGAQHRMVQYKIKKSKISRIFISHLHGDHIFGLPGLLNSMSLAGREKNLTVYGPKGIAKYLNTCFEISHAHSSFKLEIIEFESDFEGVIFENPHFKISAFPVFHRIPTFGYKFEEKPGYYKIRKEAIQTYSLTVEEIKAAKSGKLITRKGIDLDHDLIVYKRDQTVSYAYCADSVANPALIPFIRGVSLLYFETTYLEEKAEQAIERGHSTAKRSAELAQAAAVKALIIGHYSSRYKDVKPLWDESRNYFENTILGYDGTIVNLRQLN